MHRLYIVPTMILLWLVSSVSGLKRLTDTRGGFHHDRIDDGAQQISEALTQLSEAAQQTVESLRQSNLVITQLNEAAGILRNGVSRFKIQA